MTIIYNCVWDCSKCGIRIKRDTELYEISQGLVKCKKCNKKMDLIEITRDRFA